MGPAMSTSSTTVTNKFSHPVFARVDKDKMKQSSSVTNAEDFNAVMPGFTQVIPKEFVRFDLHCHGDQPVYISVFYVRNGQLKWLANDLPRKQNVHMIITEQSQLVDAALRH